MFFDTFTDAPAENVAPPDNTLVPCMIISEATVRLSIILIGTKVEAMIFVSEESTHNSIYKYRYVLAVKDFTGSAAVKYPIKA